MNGKTIVRSDDLRSENRFRMLKVLRTLGPCNTTELVKSTGLSAASISSLSTQLAEQRIVKNTRVKQATSSCGRGRPQSLIELNANAGDVINLNLSIDLIKVQRLDYTGSVLCEHSYEFNTRSLSDEQLVEAMCKAIDDCLEEAKGRRDVEVKLIGIAFQGVTDNTNGALVWSPVINDKNISLASELQNRFNMSVKVTNNSSLTAEALNNSFQNQLGSSFATVVFSHGIGLGLIINGETFNGINTSALELGHLRFERNGALCRCGRKGCIEAYAADYGIERMVNGESIHDLPSGRVDPGVLRRLSELADNNDKAIIQAFAVAGAAIGEGLCTLFTLFDPMPVALVGRNQRCVELMNGGIRSALANHCRTINVDKLLHHFDSDDALLDAGLSLNTLSRLDQQLAYTKAQPNNIFA